MFYTWCNSLERSEALRGSQILRGHHIAGTKLMIQSIPSEGGQMQDSVWVNDSPLLRRNPSLACKSGWMSNQTWDKVPTGNIFWRLSIRVRDPSNFSRKGKGYTLSHLNRTYTLKKNLTFAVDGGKNCNYFYLEELR